MKHTSQKIIRRLLALFFISSNICSKIFFKHSSTRTILNIAVYYFFPRGLPVNVDQQKYYCYQSQRYIQRRTLRLVSGRNVGLNSGAAKINVAGGVLRDGFYL
mmetsp:Transcript_2342/g.4679  ORF Transcript_2342/g.4679 Transcript_2342/m.4679 type:complete len:103 (+) Transcript_2342:1-309(+)